MGGGGADAHGCGVLAEWLAPMGLEEFRAAHLQRSPYARPHAAAGSLPLLQWPTLDRVLASPRPLDLLTVAAGRLAAVPPPRSLAEVRALMRTGISVVIRAAERHDDGLDRLARSFAEALPGEVHVQLYATPGGTHSYGWHYDFEDVFIAQTAGTKDYFFRQNTVAAAARLGQPLDFALIRDERTPLYSTRLEAGDWLYLPARWWHLVRCVADSLSISVGVMPPEAFRTAARVPAGWTGPRTQEQG
jgi:50S ribosomal protein L16 3-hydroxylase